MWWKHIQVVIALVFLTIAVLSLLPVAILTGCIGDYTLSDVVALYDGVVKDICTK